MSILASRAVRMIFPDGVFLFLLSKFMGNYEKLMRQRKANK
jgi:hypothetical protein